MTASRGKQRPTNRNIAGTMLMVINANFHWTAMATMKAAKNVATAWKKIDSFSAMPELILLPLVMTWEAIAPLLCLSKYQASFRKVCSKKAIRRALVVLIAAILMDRVAM